MKSNKTEAILSIHSTTKGMGWVVATSAQDLLDWGVSRTRGDKNAMCLRKTKELVERFAPHAIVMRHAAGSSKKRVKRIRALIAMIEKYAKSGKIEVKVLSQRDVRDAFERFGAKTREQMAKVLAANIDALSSHLPPPRKPWMAENPRLGLFDAAALAAAFFIDRDLIESPFRKAA